MLTPGVAVADPSLSNADLAPTTAANRTWGTYNYIALWFSMSMEVTTYMLASSLIAGGMNWKQALFTILMGNLIVLLPMLLNAHAGAKYGIPFPVFVRASFGALGANIPAMLRALVLQLSSQLNDNHALLSRLYDCYRNATPPDQDLEDCMHQLVRAFEHVYIILDALDESPRNKHRWGVLKTLVIIREWSEPGLHLLVTSRDETDIRDVLRDELYASLDEIVSMKNDSVRSDIASFVSCYLKDSRGLQRWGKYHDQIEKALTERANGVCVLRFLSREFY